MFIKSAFTIHSYYIQFQFTLAHYYFVLLSWNLLINDPPGNAIFSETNQYFENDPL